MFLRLFLTNIVFQERVDIVFKWKDSSLFIITGFGVSTAILNFADFSCRQCKLNFGPLRGHVKSCHFHERMAAGRHIFTFYTNFLAGNDLDYPLDLGLDNAFWIQKYLTLLQTACRFSHTKHRLASEN